MSADDAPPSPARQLGEEFLFGPLSTEAGRIEEAQREKKGFFDLALLEPLDLRPGEPIRLRFRSGTDVSLKEVRVFWTCDGSTPAWNGEFEAQPSIQTVKALPFTPEWTRSPGASSKTGGLTCRPSPMEHCFDMLRLDLTRTRTQSPVRGLNEIGTERLMLQRSWSTDWNRRNGSGRPLSIKFSSIASRRHLVRHSRRTWHWIAAWVARFGGLSRSLMTLPISVSTHCG